MKRPLAKLQNAWLVVKFSPLSLSYEIKRYKSINNRTLQAIALVRKVP
ncbi:hypothetical protein LC607_00195 [Nostoc sp. CHAB 5824]|nr:hypothetical protein [Nostoc sp. CHAB 5824]